MRLAGWHLSYEGGSAIRFPNSSILLCECEVTQHNSLASPRQHEGEQQQQRVAHQRFQGRRSSATSHAAALGLVVSFWSHPRARNKQFQIPNSFHARRKNGTLVAERPCGSCWLCEQHDVSSSDIINLGECHRAPRPATTQPDLLSSCGDRATEWVWVCCRGCDKYKKKDLALLLH